MDADADAADGGGGGGTLRGEIDSFFFPLKSTDFDFGRIFGGEGLSCLCAFKRGDVLKPVVEVLVEVLVEEVEEMGARYKAGGLGDRLGGVLEEEVEKEERDGVEEDESEDGLDLIGEGDFGCDLGNDFNTEALDFDKNDTLSCLSTVALLDAKWSRDLAESVFMATVSTENDRVEMLGLAERCVLIFPASAEGFLLEA